MVCKQNGHTQVQSANKEVRIILSASLIIFCHWQRMSQNCRICNAGRGFYIEKHYERDTGRRTDNPRGSEGKTGNTARGAWGTLLGQGQTACKKGAGVKEILPVLHGELQ